jgi:hypothetical protein
MSHSSLNLLAFLLTFNIRSAGTLLRIYDVFGVQQSCTIMNHQHPPVRGHYVPYRSIIYLRPWRRTLQGIITVNSKP